MKSPHTEWIDTYFEKCLLITSKITCSVPNDLIFRYYGTVGMCCTIMMEVPKCLWKNVRRCMQLRSLRKLLNLIHKMVFV